MTDTGQLWEMFREEKYDVYLFTVTLEEIENCPETKRSRLSDCLEQINYTSVRINSSVAEIAEQIIEMGILTKKSYDVCQHIRAAIISKCDCIISWNFKHIVKIKTIRGIRTKTNLKSLKPIVCPNFTIDNIHKLSPGKGWPDQLPYSF